MKTNHQKFKWYDIQIFDTNGGIITEFPVRATSEDLAKTRPRVQREVNELSAYSVVGEIIATEQVQEVKG